MLVLLQGALGCAGDLVQGHCRCFRAEVAQGLVESLQSVRIQFVAADMVAAAGADLEEIEEAVREGHAVASRRNGL